MSEPDRHSLSDSNPIYTLTLKLQIRRLFLIEIDSKQGHSLCVDLKLSKTTTTSSRSMTKSKLLDLLAVAL